MADRSPPAEGGPGPNRSLGATLIEVWQQALVDGRGHVELGDERPRVGRTGQLGLRTAAFHYGSELLEGIEQNPNTKSRWAKLAQEGKRIMQFRSRGRYVANVCDGQLTRYPAWKALGLPE